MTMSHKAYAFDHAAFTTELAPLLRDALQTGSRESLDRFVDHFRPVLSHPWGAVPLPASWREELEVGDVQEVADLALTKYYTPDGEAGVGEAWPAWQESAPPDVARCLLGAPFGPVECPFDPGRMGSYFQSPEEVIASQICLSRMVTPSLARFKELLAHAASLRKGLYVTF